MLRQYAEQQRNASKVNELASGSIVVEEVIKHEVGRTPKRWSR
jgi:hypothetical protein